MPFLPGGWHNLTLPAWVFLAKLLQLRALMPSLLKSLKVSLSVLTRKLMLGGLHDFDDRRVERGRRLGLVRFGR